MRRPRGVLDVVDVERVDASFGVRSLSLFGSTARDEAGAESDVDLLVDFEGPATFDRFMDVKLHLEEALGCRVDLATRQALRERLGAVIEREAILVVPPTPPPWYALPS